MKKLSSLILFAFFLMSMTLSSASAEKTDFVDENYDFTKLTSIYLFDVELNEPKNTSELVEKVMQQDYDVNAKKFRVYKSDTPAKAMKKLSLLLNTDVEKAIADNPEAGSKLFADNLHLIADAYVTSELINYYNDQYIIPAHTEWQTVTDYVDYVDNDGKKQRTTISRQVPIYVPDAYVDQAHVTMRFALVDAKTGKDIFLREETRTNTYTRDTRECFRQTVRSFFRDLKKKIKK